MQLVEAEQCLSVCRYVVSVEYKNNLSQLRLNQKMATTNDSASVDIES
jgi:hypothetical protein